MKRTIFSLLVIFAALSASAQMSPATILQNAISTLDADNGISATVKVSSGQESDTGTLYMSGSQFSMIFDDIKVWYNGRTMWSYSKENREVNITEPTLEELQVTSPYAIVQSAFKSYNASMLKAAAGIYALRLTPKVDNDIREIVLTLNRHDYRIRGIKIVTSDGSVYKTDISNYKAKNKFAKSQFVFDKKAVPAKTIINDLR